MNYPHEQIENVGSSLRGHAETLRSTASSGGGGLPSGSLGSLAEGTTTTISSHLAGVPGQIQQMADREEGHGERLGQNAQAMLRADQDSRARLEAIQPVTPAAGPSGGAGGGAGGGGRGPTAPGSAPGRDPAWDNAPLFPMPVTNGRQIADLTQYPGGVQRDENGLITHVGGRPVEEVTDQIGLERAQKYREEAKANGQLSQAKIRQKQQDNTFVSARTAGGVTAVVVDRRTGRVYEGINGTAANLVPRQNANGPLDPNALHPTLQANIDQMQAAGPYPAYDRTGQLEDPPTRAFPHYDNPYGHAEMKAENAALWDRRQAGLPDGPDAQGEMYAQTYRPFDKMNSPDANLTAMPFCTNCNHTMGGTQCYSGRYTGFPPDPNTNLTGQYTRDGGAES